MIIPSIDISKGKVVQLENGMRKKIEIDSISEVVERFSGFNEVQVIDIDLAKGEGNNQELVKALCKKVNARVGGGVRSVEKAKWLVEAGAKKVIVGSRAERKFLEELCKEIGKEKIVVALDCFDGEIVVNGWKEKTGKGPLEVIKELEPFCAEFFFTAVEREGLLKGFDLEMAKQIRKETTNRLVVAGGISSLEECAEIGKIGADCCVGMALYTGVIKDEEIRKANELDWEKGKGLIPAIVQDFGSKEILMLAYMSKESLQKTIESGNATYFSRSRNKLWVKGESSGNFQKVKEILFDCDKDAILIKVEQKGFACHTGNLSCFYRNYFGGRS